MNRTNTFIPSQPLTSSKLANTPNGANKINSTKDLNGKPLLRIQPQRSRARNLIINLPIGTRLILGFLVAAIIAAVGSGYIGIQHAQIASQQSNFYKSLLQTNTNLTTGGQYLQVIHSQVGNVIADLDTQQPSQETLAQDKQSLNNLITLYNTLLTNYISQDLLSKHPEQEAILASAGRSYQTQQQIALASSALRTWQSQQASLTAINTNINAGNIAQAKYLQQVQVDPTNADALSAIRALTQFNSYLADSVSLAEQAEAQQEIITTIVSAVIAFILIVLVGLFISGTIIRRLGQLRQVTQAVEQGQLDRRVQVVGRDEIADVSASVNAMLDAMVTLLDETRNQRDALTNAAEHLFTDMRVVSAGDLRINAPVSNDPIGMLANAFNFTVGRFRRFVQRTKTTAEQLDVLSYQQVERAENFTQNVLILKNNLNVAQTTKNSGTHPRAYFDPETQQMLQELLKQSTTFASDMYGGARQVSALGQEIRTGIINFQLDTAENINNAASGNNSLNNVPPYQSISSPGTSGSQPNLPNLPNLPINDYDYNQQPQQKSPYMKPRSSPGGGGRITFTGFDDNR
ncbi:HAMP domain-containing protein [Ktedonobacteria bacterium brp13]|nr:HAMP domain-containing protein [Ktedonobacteria bacterium brp13]